MPTPLEDRGRHASKKQKAAAALFNSAGATRMTSMMTEPIPSLVERLLKRADFHRQIANRGSSGSSEALADCHLLAAAAQELERFRAAAAKELEQLKADRIPERECFWLIERMTSPPLYMDEHSGLTNDAWAAKRFKTEREAQDYWRVMTGFRRTEYRVIQHMFVNRE